MFTEKKYILVDGKYLLNADHVESVGSIHTVEEFSDKSQAPSGATDLTTDSISDSSYRAASYVSMYETAGSIELNMVGREIMYNIDQYADRKGVAAAMVDRSIAFSWKSE